MLLWDKKEVITAERELDRIWQPMRVRPQRGGIGLGPSKDETGKPPALYKAFLFPVVFLF